MQDNFTNEYTMEQLAASTDSAAVAETLQSADSGYNLDEPASLGEAAGIMGKGMLGVFVVIGVLILCIYALNSAGKKKKKKDEDNK